MCQCSIFSNSLLVMTGLRASIGVTRSFTLVARSFHTNNMGMSPDPFLCGSIVSQYEGKNLSVWSVWQYTLSHDCINHAYSGLWSEDVGSCDMQGVWNGVHIWAARRPE